MKRVIIGLAATLFLSAGALAAQLTLQEVEAKALSANPTLQAARFDTLAAQKHKRTVFGHHFGSVDLIGSSSHYERNRVVVPMALDLLEKNPSAGFGALPWDANPVRYGISWQIPLLASGALHEGDRIAGLQEEKARKMLFFTRDRIRFNVRTAYRNVLLYRHALTAAQTYEKALEKDDQDAKLKVKLGAWPDVREAKVAYDLHNARATVSGITASLHEAEAVLAAFMGEDAPPEGFDLAETGDIPQPPRESLDSLTTRAVAYRGDMLATRAQTGINEHKHSLAKEAFAPQLFLHGNYLWNNAPSLSDTINTHEITLSVKIPLFKGFSRISAIEETDAALQAARHREKAKELDIKRQVIKAEAGIKSAQALYEAGKTNRKLGNEVARVEHLKLEKGTGNMEDYLAALAKKMQGEAGYWKGLYTYQNALDYLTFVTTEEAGK